MTVRFCCQIDRDLGLLAMISPRYLLRISAIRALSAMFCSPYYMVILFLDFSDRGFAYSPPMRIHGQQDHPSFVVVAGSA
jgi:hypothetical protein